MSAKFERFKRSFFTSPCYQDGPDLAVLDLLEQAKTPNVPSAEVTLIDRHFLTQRRIQD